LSSLFTKAFSMSPTFWASWSSSLSNSTSIGLRVCFSNSSVMPWVVGVPCFLRFVLLLGGVGFWLGVCCRALTVMIFLGDLRLVCKLRMLPGGLLLLLRELRRFG
jgi:hypothetical protein